MYSRYLETQYVGWSNKIEYVINAFIQIIMKMGMLIIFQADDEFNTKEFRAFCEEHGIYYFFWKPYENPKNQLIERPNLTIKRFMKTDMDGLVLEIWLMMLSKYLMPVHGIVTAYGIKALMLFHSRYSMGLMRTVRIL
jgi:hypothetical protein